MVLAFFDGEELFFKGAAAYLVTRPKPDRVRAVVNLDMIGQNPIADRLDLIWYLQGSAALRDRVVAANDRYAIGIRPLNAQFAGDATTILDAAPFGLAGIPAVALVERYGTEDATYPGNPVFHTVNDDVAHVTNKRLWLKRRRSSRSRSRWSSPVHAEAPGSVHRPSELSFRLVALGPPVARQHDRHRPVALERDPHARARASGAHLDARAAWSPPQKPSKRRAPWPRAAPPAEVRRRPRRTSA